MKNQNTTWPMQPIGDLLKQVRRPVDVGPDTTYRQIGIRSHCKGIFHKPETTGEQIGKKRVFWIEPGCLMINIIFAWEQAVAMTSDAEVGMIASHRFPMYQSRNGKLLAEYAWRYFSTPRGKYDLSVASPGGAGRNKTLGQEEFKRLKVPVPNLQNQHQAVEILSTVDRAMEQTNQLIKVKRKLKKGLAQQLLGGHRRLPGFKEVWSKRTLGESVGSTQDTASPSQGLFHHRKECGQSGLPVLSVTIDRGLVHRRTLGRKDSGVLPPERHLMIREGDLAYNMMRMWQGACGVSKEDGIVSPAYVVLEPAQNVDPWYVYQLLKTPRMLYLLCAYSYGVTADRLRLYYKDFAMIPCLIPPIQEQRRIAAVLRAADIEIALLNKKLAALSELKRGLMQRLIDYPHRDRHHTSTGAEVPT